MSAVGRVKSLDVVRGVVMVLMAIDHVRVYAGVPAGGPTAGVFFTRWVTHFCAPAFVFLAGTAAFLLGRQLGDRRRLVRFLVTRGLTLVILELTLVRAAWTFNFQYSQFVLAGVIWMIGWCMVLLAPLTRLSTRTIAIAGVSIMLLQQVFGLMPNVLPESTRHAIGPFWSFIYPSSAPEPSAISILYVLVPWIGVMAAGYAFGAIVIREPQARDRWCRRIGLTAIALFGVFVVVFMAFAPGPDDGGPKIFHALNPPKYPASQPFLLMTLGPAIALLPLAERARGWLAGAFATFGRVPMFYYLLHIPLIHAAALAVTRLREGRIHPEWYATAPFASVPRGHAWSLPLLYLVFALCVVVLYAACRWFAAIKARRSDWWLRYI